MGVISPIWLWPAAAVLAALSGILILLSAARASKAAKAAGEDPARAVYRRQLDDLDDLVERGLLQPDEREAARAEAARRLLAAPASRAPEAPGSRLWPLAAAGAAALVALGLYLWLGSPSTPDQPFRARLAQWRETPLDNLRIDEVAAVLREEAKTRPKDARLLALLAKLERQGGDTVAAAMDYQKAVDLQPGDADLQAALGEAIAAAAGDKPTPDAEAALRRALAIDPNNQAALYYLGGLKAQAGERVEAAGFWRRLAAQLPDADRRKAQLLDAADGLEKGAPPPAEDAGAQMQGSASAPFIRAMVASLQARLDAHPDDPAGWARLVRSYRVLGDPAAETKALARARSLFAGRPQDLAAVEAEAK